MDTIKTLPAPYDDFTVSNTGIVTRVSTSRVLKSARSSDGYVRIPLRLYGIKPRTFYVHRLVACAFVPGDQSLTVNHINGIKHDNRAENLEWISHAANIQHGITLHPGRKFGRTGRPVEAIAEDGARTWYPSGRAAAVALGHWNKAANIKNAIDMGSVAYGCRWHYARTRRKP